MKLQLKSIFSSSSQDADGARAACAQPDCENRMPARHPFRNRNGITIGEQWYCSVDCFSLAAHGLLDSLSAAEVIELPRNPRLSLGLALLTKGYLTTEQFQYASSRSETEGVDFERVVTEEGWIAERQLAAARSAQWGYPVLGHDLSGHGVTADLPPFLFRACTATPLYYSGNRLVLGFVQRVDHSLLQAIEKITDCRAEPCFITPTQLAKQLDRIEGPAGYEQVLIESPGDAAQMVRTLLDSAVQVAAVSTRFARCHSVLWSRLQGSRQTLDVLFDLEHKEAASLDQSGQKIGKMYASIQAHAFPRRANRQR